MQTISLPFSQQLAQSIAMGATSRRRPSQDQRSINDVADNGPDLFPIDDPPLSAVYIYQHHACVRNGPLSESNSYRAGGNSWRVTILTHHTVYADGTTNSVRNDRTYNINNSTAVVENAGEFFPDVIEPRDDTRQASIATMEATQEHMLVQVMPP